MVYPGMAYQDDDVTVPCSRWQVAAANHKGFVVSRCGDDIACYLASGGALARITGSDGDDLWTMEPGRSLVQ